MAVSALQEKFIEEFIKCRKGAEAARRAGYAVNSAHVAASRLLSNDNVLKEIEERTKANGMGIDEALSRLADFSRADMGQWLSDDGAVDIAAMKRDGATHFIRKVKRTEKRGVTATGGEWTEITGEVELYDALSATKFIADLHKRGATGKEDDPLHFKFIEGVSEDDR